MHNYFTAAKIKEPLFLCQKLGINTMICRGDMHMLRLIHEFQREGGSLNWICMTGGEFYNFTGRINQIMQ